MSQQSIDHPAWQALDETSLRHVSGGYVGPDQDISEFPAWALPYINIARIGQIAKVMGIQH